MDPSARNTGGQAELREKITSPGLRSKGDSMSAAWKSVLRDPHQYIPITPEEFLRPAFVCPDTHSIKVIPGEEILDIAVLSSRVAPRPISTFMRPSQHRT